MESFAENCTSRDPLCFPMATASVLLDQFCADWLVIMTDSVWWICGSQSSNIHWRVHQTWWLHLPLGTLPKLNDCSSFRHQHGSGMLEKHLYTHTSTIECMYWGNKGHTAVVMVSRYFYLFIFCFLFFCFVIQGLCCCQGSTTLHAGITTLVAGPTHSCGSTSSLELSLQVRPKETHYGHL